jgi:Zn-dependent protease with chaperone function
LQFVASLIVFPSYRRLRGVEISWWQASRAALWRSALPAPMAALLLLATDPQVILIPALAIGAAILCAVLQFWFLHNLLHALRIGGLKVAEGELRERVFALAAKANARLLRFCVIPEGAWKSVHVLTTGDRSLLIAQPVIDQLSRAEVDAIIAHELAHMRLRHRAWAILQVVACAVAVFFVETRIPREQGLIVILVLMTGLLAGIVWINSYRRQADYSADQFAVKLIENPESLITAILRLDRLRGCPLYWSLPEELLFGHTSAVGRVNAIALPNGVSKDRLAQLIAIKPVESIDPYPIPPFASARFIYLM